MQKSIHAPEYALVREELLRARTAANLSQRGLADRLRVPHSWVAKVENGERRIDIVEACRFFVACNVDPKDALLRLAAQFRPAGQRRALRRST